MEVYMKHQDSYISAKAAGGIVDLKPETLRMYPRKRANSLFR